MKNFLCESCIYGELKTVEVYKPLYAFSNQVKKVQQLTVFCNDTYTFKHKLITYKNHICNYKPKSGKIGKKLYQKTLSEN